MSEKVKRGISLAASGLAYLALAVEQFGVFDLSGVWGLVIAVAGTLFAYFGIEFVAPRREDEE